MNTVAKRRSILLACALILASCGGGGDTSSGTSSGGSSQSASAPAGQGSSGSGSTGSGTGNSSVGDLVWTAVEFGCDFIDDVEAVARVTNNGADISGAAFTITVLQGGRITATLTGFVNDLASGQTKTVEFISTDDCLQGDFEYEIQTDFSMGGSSGSSSAGSGSPGTADGDDRFTWASVDFGCDFVDDIEARGRVTNNGAAVSSAAFTITVLQGDRIAGTLTGFVNDLGSGQTKTVEFISTDDCFEGAFEYEIQTDFAM